MKERSIIFNSEMVQAILDGRKTQTRRIINPQPECEEIPVLCDDGVWRGRYQYMREGCDGPEIDVDVYEFKGYPYGQPGDRLWVRETYSIVKGHEPYYKAENPNPPTLDKIKWIASIHMPRWASRITLEITNVRVQRLQDIIEEDANLDGGFSDTYEPADYHVSFIGQFKALWESIYGSGSWEKNPWVWVIEFNKI